MLSLPLITVAALQGHTFAAGAMFSLAHDFRVMRADRGYWCLPEADINIPFTPGMSALIQSRLTPQTAHEAMITARRYGGSDAAAAGIVDQAVSEDAVRATAIEIAQAQTEQGRRHARHHQGPDVRTGPGHPARHHQSPRLTSTSPTAPPAPRALRPGVRAAPAAHRMRRQGR